MKRILLIVFVLTGIASGYWEISEGVPSVFSAGSDQQWRMWSGQEAANSLFDNSSGILIDDLRFTVIVGKFTPGASRTRHTAVGIDAGIGFTGDFTTSVGRRAGEQNTGDFHTAIGAIAGTDNDGDQNTALGGESFNAFTLDTGSAKNITSVDFANDRITISGGHGFGANGTFRNLKASTTGTLPAGLSGIIETWEIISSTVLECKTDSFTDAGTGTHTLTPQFVYTNSTALGYNAEPDASNQVMLGDTNVTEVKTAGSITAPSATLKSLTIDNTDGTDAVITMDGSSNDAGTITFESDNTSFIFSDDVQMTDGLDVTGNVIISKDLTVDTDTLYVDSVNHRVGIGTTSPDTKFQVVGTAGFGDDAGNEMLVSATGDLSFAGTAGFICGHMTIPAVDVVVDTSGTANPVEVADDGTGVPDAGDGWESVYHNGTTFAASDLHYITVTIPGTYKVIWDLSPKTAAGGGTLIHGGIMIDGAATRNNGEGHAHVVNANDNIQINGVGVIDCPNGTEEISLWISNNAAQKTEIEHGNMNVMLIGGT